MHNETSNIPLWTYGRKSKPSTGNVTYEVILDENINSCLNRFR
jgi:hypothetical protein